MLRIHALLAPAEVFALHNSDLSKTACVVFDVLRATTTLLSALEHGAAAIIPVLDIQEALNQKRLHPDYLLGGERDGRRIDASLTGGIEFDFGNSPREYDSARVTGRTILSTTTNGTKSLRACHHAAAVLPAAFLNLAATADALEHLDLPELLLVGAGTGQEAAYEDILGIGALVETLWPAIKFAECSDTIHVARAIYRAKQANLLTAVSRYSCNGRRLLALPDLAPDVAYCLRENTLNFAAKLEPDGAIRRIS